MSFQPLNTKSSDASNFGQVNDMQLQMKRDQTTKIFKDETGERRILLGKGKNGFYGLKVSQEGNDVYEAANDNLVFNSDQNVFKIVRSGTINLTQATTAAPGVGNYGTDTGTLGSVSHGLGYMPAVLAFIEFSTGARSQLPYSVAFAGSVSTAIWDTYLAVVSTSVLSIRYNRLVYGTGATTFALPVSVKYFLLQETAT